MSKKIGIYGGSFNPVHKGHVALAKYILEHGEIDEIWFLVSPNNPLKKASELADEKVRLEMVKTAIENEPKMKASDFEFYLPRPSYTIDTLRALKDAYPDTEFTLIMGSDNMAIFHMWKDFQEIIDNYPILVYPRQGDDLTELHQKWPQMNIIEGAPLWDISSTEIRTLAMQNSNISSLLDPKVEVIYRKWLNNLVN